MKMSDLTMSHDLVPTQRFDVAVVGGGPAGSICAQLLAREGARVVVADRGGIGISVVELLSGHCRRLVEDCVGSAAFPPEGSIEIVQTVSLWDTPAPVTWSSMLSPWGAGLAVARTAFDDALRQAASNAGATSLTHTDVRGIERGRLGWLLHLHEGGKNTNLSADLLVIASGRTRERFEGRNALEGIAQVALMASLSAMPSELNNSLCLEAVQDGWWYTLPNPKGGLFVGFCTEQIDKIKRRGKPLQILWMKELQRTRLISELFPQDNVGTSVMGRSAGMRSFDKVSGERWIAVGDAAFAPNPLSGKGIEFGVQSATLGARALIAGSKSSDLTDYENAICEYVRQQERTQAFYSTMKMP